MAPYRVLISVEILQLKRLSRKERDVLLSFFESLAENPNRMGDYEELDETGRPIQIKIMGDFALTFWAGHAVKEVKVTKIEKADPD